MPYGPADECRLLRVQRDTPLKWSDFGFGPTRTSRKVDFRACLYRGSGLKRAPNTVKDVTLLIRAEVDTLLLASSLFRHVVRVNRRETRVGGQALEGKGP